MPNLFSHDAATVHNFLAQDGRAFYIPLYQRPYSWDENNARDFISDILSGLLRSLIKHDNQIFLGTLILHKENSPQRGVHQDNNSLITQICNVVDGQQRITSLALLACCIYELLTSTADELELHSSGDDVFSSLAIQLKDEKISVRKWYSISVDRTQSNPKLKPLIIRAVDTSVNPAFDQWTLSGSPSLYYQSSATSFISEFINGNSVEASTEDERIKSVTSTFLNRIEDAMSSMNLSIFEDLLNANDNFEGSLSNFLNNAVELNTIEDIEPEAQASFLGGVFLVALCRFIKESCHFFIIDCQDESLAFDMFQSLNATGTPLTALEVFKPVVLRDFGAEYVGTAKPYFDRLDGFLNEITTSVDRDEATHKILASFAFVHDGSQIAKRLGSERDWLEQSYSELDKVGKREFLRRLADQASFWSKFIKPRKPNAGSITFSTVNDLVNLSLTPLQADIAALCIFFLRDANHKLGHSVISVFYSKLLFAQNLQLSELNLAAAEFVEACKATAAFFTLYMGGMWGRFPDSFYKDLFSSELNGLNFKSCVSNQNSTFLKNAYKQELSSAKNKAFHPTDVELAKSRWVELAKESPWYTKRALCKFALFHSFHNAVVDLSDGKEGLFIDAQQGTANFLNCAAWYSNEYGVIEHVATQNKPATIYFKDHFDETIYPGNRSVVDKLGNLTLLSLSVNSSIESEWPAKVFYYWGLTNAQGTVNSPTGEELKSALGISSVPPGFPELTATTNYASHLVPLAYRGKKGLKWDSEFIDSRSSHLCERVFNSLNKWLT